MRVGGYDVWERHPRSRMRDSEGRLVQRWPPKCRGFATPRTLAVAGSYKSTPAMLPMADGAVVRLDSILFNGIYNWETLRRLPDGGGGGWHASPLPKPPIGRLADHVLGSELALVTAYFARGTRVWISVPRKGTFSLDTGGGGGGASWRVEGAWQLPFEGRGLYVPELDSVFGFTAGSGGLLCACDVGAGAPPVTRRAWAETFPFPWEECVSDDDGRHPETRVRDLPSLAYLGKGRFCICRPMSTMEPTDYGTPITYDASSFLAVEVKRLPSGELRLARRGKMSYMRTPQRRPCRYIGLV